MTPQIHNHHIRKRYSSSNERDRNPQTLLSNVTHFTAPVSVTETRSKSTPTAAYNDRKVCRRYHTLRLHTVSLDCLRIGMFDKKIPSLLSSPSPNDHTTGPLLCLRHSQQLVPLWILPTRMCASSSLCSPCRDYGIDLR